MTSGMWVLRGGTVIDEHGARRCDVAVAGETICAVGDIPAGARSVDVDGCYVLPGLVDIQVHFRTPGGECSETMESGAAAAALGGVTACVMMPNTDPPIDSVEMVREVRRRAVGLCCDVVTSAAVTVGRRGGRLTDLVALYGAGVRVFTDDGAFVASSALMRDALAATTALPGAVIAQHAEDTDLVEGCSHHDGSVASAMGVRGRPREAEEIAVARDLVLARGPVVATTSCTSPRLSHWTSCASPAPRVSP